MNLQVVGENLLIEVEEKSATTKSGLFIPTAQNEGAIIQGKVVQCGSGKTDSNGKKMSMTISVGDSVWFPKMNATELKVDEQKRYVIPESYIIAYSKY